MKRAFVLAALVTAYANAVYAATPAEYPTKPVRVIVSTSPSGGTDYAARLFGQKLSEIWGQSIVIDNRPGATGMIGLDVVAHANPDGYTLLVMNVGHLITATLSARLTFDPVKDLLPVSVVATTPVICVVHPAVNAKSVPELIALAKAQPGKLLYASGGTGGVQHVATELFKQEAKIDVVHVPYKGTGPGLIDLISGQVQLTMTSVPSVVPHVSSGRLRALAVTGEARLEALPSVPTFKEVGLPGVNVVIWYGLLAPARTPLPIVNRIASSVGQAARSPDMKEKMLRGGADPVGNTPAEFGTYYKSERDRWGLIARQAKIRIE